MAQRHTRPDESRENRGSSEGDKRYVPRLLCVQFGSDDAYVANTGTHLTNFIFDGARADLTKGLSMNPAFQVTHSFSLASQANPSQYNFGAVFASNKVALLVDVYLVYLMNVSTGVHARQR